MTSSELKAFIVRYTDAVWNARNVAAMDQFYAPNYAHHDVSRPDVRTLDDYRAWGSDLMGGLSGLHVRIDDVIADDAGNAVKRWTASGTHDRTLAGIPATDRKASFQGVSIYRVVGDRIVESWYLYDMMGLLQQLGVLPAPASS